VLCCILVLLALWRLNRQVTQTNWCKNHAPANGANRAKGKNRANSPMQRPTRAPRKVIRAARGKNAPTVPCSEPQRIRQAPTKKIARKIDTLHKKYDDARDQTLPSWLVPQRANQPSCKRLLYWGFLLPYLIRADRKSTS